MASSANNNGSAGKWEVVRRGKKQSSAAKSQGDKKSRKALIESNSPKLDLFRKSDVLFSLRLYSV